MSEDRSAAEARSDQRHSEDRSAAEARSDQRHSEDRSDQRHSEDRSAALLEVSGLEVVFDGFRAIDGLDISVEEGELRFLIGPNGAGKTTLVDVITGLTRPAAGSVRFAGEELVGRREHDIVRLGIGRSFQTPTVFDHLTVVENIDLAASVGLSWRALLRRRRGIDGPVAEALDTVGLEPAAERPAGELSHGQKQWLEIGMLLVQDPRLLLLDEPVAGMSREERTRTGELLQLLCRSRTVLVVEHDMDFLRRFASKVTVMHEGKVLCEGGVAEVQANATVQEVYLGRPDRKTEGTQAPTVTTAAG